MWTRDWSFIFYKHSDWSAWLLPVCVTGWLGGVFIFRLVRLGAPCSGRLFRAAVIKFSSGWGELLHLQLGVAGGRYDFCLPFLRSKSKPSLPRSLTVSLKKKETPCKCSLVFPFFFVANLSCIKRVARISKFNFQHLFRLYFLKFNLIFCFKKIN